MQHNHGQSPNNRGNRKERIGKIIIINQISITIAMCEILNVKREMSQFGLTIGEEGILYDWLALCLRTKVNQMDHVAEVIYLTVTKECEKKRRD